MKYLLIALVPVIVLVMIKFSSPDDSANVALDVEESEVQSDVVNNTAAEEKEEYEVDLADFVEGASLVADLETEQLTEMEAAGLIFMREEEKLARDVYIALYEKWGARVFDNISSSEQTHMDAVLTLLDRYNLNDPASSERGVFTNVELQSIYNDLFSQGSVSLAEAYKVGATIEDLDIRDLEDYLAATDNTDIVLVYENLQRGSRNHLRAFNRQLVALTGSNYEPLYINQAEFDSIIGSDTERGPRGGRRN